MGTRPFRNFTPGLFLFMMLLSILGLVARVPLASVLAGFTNAVLIRAGVPFQATTVLWWGILTIMGILKTSTLSEADSERMETNPWGLVGDKTADAFGVYVASFVGLGIAWGFMALWWPIT